MKGLQKAVTVTKGEPAGFSLQGFLLARNKKMQRKRDEAVPSTGRMGILL